MGSQCVDMEGLDDWVDWIVRYRAHLELKGLAARTVKAREWLVSRFIGWCAELGLSGPQRITVDLLSDYRRHRIQSVNARGRRDRAFTVNTHILALRDFFGFLAARGVAPGGLLGVLAYLKEPKLLPKHTLSHAEVMRILESVPADTPIHVRDRAVFEVLYSCGIRREELVCLDLAALDLEGGVIRVEKGKGAKERVAPVGRHAVEWLCRYLAAARPSLLGGRKEHGRVFVSKRGLPLDGTSVLDIVKRWARAAGIEKPVGPHTLRRSCATGMIRGVAGVGHVKDLLGHQDFASLDSYVKLAIVDLKEALAKYHPRENMPDKGAFAGAKTQVPLDNPSSQG
jgi:integrase/recombinase XerD